MGKEFHPCEAPEHHENCDGRGTSIDHFTPKCIGKLMGWSRSQINAPENLQWLSDPCHTAKDIDTPLRKEVLRRQLKEGLSIPFETHVAVFEQRSLEPLNSIEMVQGQEYQIPKTQSSRLIQRQMRRSLRRA